MNIFIEPKSTTISLTSFLRYISGVEHLVPKDDRTGEDMIALVQSIYTDPNVNDQSLHDGYQPPGHSF